MTARFSNQFQSYLTEPLNIDATVINIPPEDVKGLPILNDTDWFPLNISDPRGFEEIVHVTKVNADGTLVVKRAQEGTEAKNFRVESRVDIRLTAQSIESFLGLYYGARTVPPSNAQTGAAYLDITKNPNTLKVLGANGWADAVSYSLAGLRQQLFVPTEATKGPFTVPGGFTSGFANVNGLSVYAGHGMTIDAANASFKLDDEVPAGTIIVFQGYLANDAVDVFTKAEINNRFAELSANDVKETDDRKYMTPNERTKITDIDNRLSNFNADNLTETATHKVMTAAERIKLSNINALAASLWNAGADGTEALISPVKLRDAINARFGGNLASGWMKMPNGMLIQWGNAVVASGNGYWQIFFPTAFTKKGIFLPTIATEWTGEWFAPIVFTAASDNTNLNMRGLHLRQTTGTNSVSYLNSCNVQWLAIGY